MTLKEMKHIVLVKYNNSILSIKSRHMYPTPTVVPFAEILVKMRRRY